MYTDDNFNAASLMQALYHLCDEDDLRNIIVRVLDEARNVYGTLLTVQGEVSPDGSASVTLIVEMDR